MKKLCFFILLALCSFSTFSQKINIEQYRYSPQNQSLWNNIQKAILHKNKRQVDSLQNLIFTGIYHSNDPQGLLRMCNELTHYHLEQRNFEKGKHMMDTLLNVYRKHYDTTHIEFGFLHSNMAHYYHMHNQFGKRKNHQEIQLKIIRQINSNHPLLVDMYTEKTASHFANRQLDQGFAAADSALKLAAQNQLHYYTTTVYMHMANVLKFYEPHLALDFMDFTAYYAMEYQKEHFENDPYFYINRGACYVAVDNPGNALNQFKKGLRVLKKQSNPPVNFETAFYYYIGVCYKNLAEYEKASVFYDSAATIFANHFSKKHRAYLRNTSLAARNMLQAGEYKKALPILEETYKLTIDTYGFDNTYFTIQAGTDLAEALLHTGQYQKALEQYHQNINYFYGDSVKGNPFILPGIDSTGKGQDRTGLFLSYLGKAKAMEKLFEQEQSASLLDNIFEHYKACSEISDITSNMGPLDDKDARIVAYHLKKLTNTSLDFASSFELSQEKLKTLYKIISKSKAYSLLSSIHKKQEGYYGSDTPLKDLSTSIQQLEEKLKVTGQKPGEEYERLFSKLLEHKKNMFLYKYHHPVTTEKVSINRVANIASQKVNSGIREKEAVIDIYLTDNNITVFYIDNEKFQFNSNPLTDKLLQDCIALRRSIKTASTINDLNRNLYNEIIGKMAPEVTHKEALTIIPDGFLYTIPFEVLTTNKNSYLVENYAIRYRYTSHLYQTSPVTHTNKSFFALAPVFQKQNNTLNFQNPLRKTNTDSVEFLRGGKQQLETLPYTREETQNLQEFFETRNWQTRLLLNKQASEENFNKFAPDYSIIHMATHGYVDHENPENSGLFLSQDNSNTKEDNYLHMSELYNLNIQANLVVLSACKSGYGKIWKGEGILALPRAFLAGGTKNVISSLWNVHDEKTKKLMVKFYEAIAQEPDYTRALQKAKTEMIKEGEIPMDWSGFTLIWN